MDLYLFNTIINSAWYLFTVLFILYRFTTFFSHAYNFFKFCGKIVSGGKYAIELCFNYFKQKQYEPETTDVIDEDDTDNQHEVNVVSNETFVDKIKNKVNSVYYAIYHKISGKYHPLSQENSLELPLYQSSNHINNNSTDNYNDIINSFSKNQNYSSLFESNFKKNMYTTIDLDKSTYYNNPRQKHKDQLKILIQNEPKPFGINDSSLLFNSSFINKKLESHSQPQLHYNKPNLPFAMNSFISTSLHPLHENYQRESEEYNDKESYKESDEESMSSYKESDTEQTDLLESKYQECE